MFSRVLIANRGEIAVRIIRACRELGLETVAVYSDADRDALHVSLADDAVHIGPAPAAESYLHISRLVDAALESGAGAVHPGFGFLSENAFFARAVRNAGLVFIGPSAEAIAAMGSKTGARAMMSQAGVPVVPGYQGPDFSPDRLLEEAAVIGYPVLVKAAAGGGGKGMRVVHSPQELLSSVDAARREARKAFADDAIFLERYLTNPRHIEFQIFGDQHGQVVHLFERECSIQRRHQKVLEESPSVALTPELRARMGRDAVNAARAVGYHNAGTVEFIVDEDGSYFFLEMNTRLQVEHPVTELVTGVDLVKLQLRVAQGEPLPFTQADVSQRGHAIEVRIYAEDPANGFLPVTGRILALQEPVGPGVRVDSSLFAGMEIPVHYDPMLAKLIVWGADRMEAIGRMRRALEDYVILGVTTNAEFLRAVVEHPVYQQGQTFTSFIPRYLPDWKPRQHGLTTDMLVAAAVAELLDEEQAATARGTGDASLLSGDPTSPWERLGRWRA